MDIDWEQIQKLLTFLIIFIAPAILSRFKKQEDEDDEDNPLTQLRHQDLAGTKPIVLKDIQSEVERKAEEAVKPKHKSSSKATPKVDSAPPVRKTLVERSVLKPMEANSAYKKSNKILGVSAKKAMMIKEVLGPPRGVNPF